ncbi:sensor histidine kinase [Sphingomonas quercus]|nr:HWE histidine kinase domain-containing protein [Sphingomonas quercus]
MKEDNSAAASRRSEERFRAFVTASTDAVYRVSPDWSELRELDGRGFLHDTQAPRSNWLDDYVETEDQPRVKAAIAEAIRSRGVFELEHRVRRVDGTLGWTLSRAVPILDDDGEVVEWLGAASDVTARREAQEELARVTAESERQKHFYEALISSTPDLIYAFDRDYRFIFANQALLGMWNRTLPDSIGRTLLEVGYEPWHAEMHEREIDEVAATGKPVRGEVGFPHATLGWRIYDYILTPIMNAAGGVESIGGTTRDITDIKRAEEHLKLLINELNHRVKNTLATVLSIASQTFRGGAAEPRARAAFEARLIALSDAHTILTRSNWEGASLRAIAVQALAPFHGDGTDPDRISVDGADIQLRPQMAVALAMALHELATNAVDHGALSGDAGRVSLSWTCDGQMLSISWREVGGPAVAPPSRRGFGARLVEQGLPRELNGSVQLDYQPAGVICTIKVPISEKDQE